MTDWRTQVQLPKLSEYFHYNLTKQLRLRLIVAIQRNQDIPKVIGSCSRRCIALLEPISLEDCFTGSGTRKECMQDLAYG